MSQTLFETLSKVLVPIAGKLNNSRYLQVLRDAFMLAFPLTIFGSIAVVIANLPFLDKVMSENSLNTLKEMLGVAPNATMGVMTIFVVFGIGYYLSKSYEVEGIFGGAIALASFLLLTPFVLQVEGKEAVQGVIPLDRLGAKGMFLGMITAFVAGEIYRKIVQKKYYHQNAGRGAAGGCEVVCGVDSGGSHPDLLPRRQYHCNTNF